ncbi:MAG TPA: DNA polymerase III subunit chi [Telluria sp.]|jgi:DNA polymerase-3 subunit chi
MTRVDFHTNIADKVSYACRLARKAYGAGGKLVLLAQDAEQAAMLDAALWTVGDTDFLPHAIGGTALAAHSPIVVTDNMNGPFPHHDMLVNLTRARPEGIERFQRVFEIVTLDEDDAAAGRQRYVAYKQQAFPLTHFVAASA